MPGSAPFVFRHLLFLMIFCTRLQAAEVSIAAAANFTDAMRALIPQFESATGHTTSVSYGSTGKLFSQIENGAPYDVFLAADTRRPALAEEQGLAIPGSLFVYARGRLVLWSTNEHAHPLVGSWLGDQETGRIAIANPKTAPYGLAAMQVLEHLGIWQTVQTRLVRGDSISQTFQFVASGNAEFGFVAASQLKAWQGTARSRWEIPPEYHSPIEQAATLLRRGKTNPAALLFLEFLRSDTAQVVISDCGYDTAQNTAASKPGLPPTILE